MAAGSRLCFLLIREEDQSGGTFYVDFNVSACIRPQIISFPSPPLLSTAFPFIPVPHTESLCSSLLIPWPSNHISPCLNVFKRDVRGRCCVRTSMLTAGVNSVQERSLHELKQLDFTVFLFI